MDVTHEFLAKSAEAVRTQAAQAQQQYWRCVGALDLIGQLRLHLAKPGPDDEKTCATEGNAVPAPKE